MAVEQRLYWLKPIVRSCSWGGKRLAKQFDIETCLDRPGEIVAAGGFGERDSEVIGLGIKLSQLYSASPELFGTDSPTFPLTVNLIDAAEPLSVQVHPSDDYSIRNGGGYGLSEAWVVLDCEQESNILIGHTAESSQAFQSRVSAGEWEELFRYIKAEKGAFYFLPPGTVHSIGGGVRIYEVTHASDIVYRLYDYGRDDKERPLDTRKALDNVYSPQHVHTSTPKETIEHYNLAETLYIDIPFSIRRLEVRGPACWKQHRFGVLTVIDGHGSVNGKQLLAGNTVLIPHGFDELALTGSFTAMLSSFNE